MLSDVFDDSGMVRILDYLLDMLDPNWTFAQKDVCEYAKVSRPTAVKAFKVLKRNGLIRRVKGGYKLLLGEKSPMNALMAFDMRICYFMIKKNRKK
jgi:Mn-dependent DtxR family transcriptional regulator